MGKDIDTIRSRIDALDNELLELLRRRFELCVEMGRIKSRGDREVFDPAREEAILERLTSKARPPLSPAMVESVFTRIFGISRSLQKRRTVTYLGPEGSYSHQAAALLFEGDELLPQRDLDTVVGEVATGRADLGVVPVENSAEGMVNRTLDLMATSRLFVNQEIMLPIRNCLLSCSAMEKVHVVYSHPQALAQCRRWLVDNLPAAEIREAPSTSEAAMAARSQEHVAAVASALSARIYGLNVLAENINDSPDNLTRFWVISPAMATGGENAKTSIIVTLGNHPGSLHEAIGVFAGQGINLTKIESRPSKKNPWEYIFFIDFQGSLEDVNVKRAMKELSRHTTDIITLGSYPEGRRLS
jgi:chorismate mutase/prephenate dehydratase